MPKSKAIQLLNKYVRFKKFNEIGTIKKIILRCNKLAALVIVSNNQHLEVSFEDFTKNWEVIL